MLASLAQGTTFVFILLSTGLLLLTGVYWKYNKVLKIVILFIFPQSSKVSILVPGCSSGCNLPTKNSSWVLVSDDIWPVLRSAYHPGSGNLEQP